MSPSWYHYGPAQSNCSGPRRQLTEKINRAQDWAVASTVVWRCQVPSTSLPGAWQVKIVSRAADRLCDLSVSLRESKGDSNDWQYIPCLPKILFTVIFSFPIALNVYFPTSCLLLYPRKSASLDLPMCIFLNLPNWYWSRQETKWRNGIWVQGPEASDCMVRTYGTYATLSVVHSSYYMNHCGFDTDINMKSLLFASCVGHQSESTMSEYIIQYVKDRWLGISKMYKYEGALELAYGLTVYGIYHLFICTH